MPAATKRPNLVSLTAQKLESQRGRVLSLAWRFQDEVRCRYDNFMFYCSRPTAVAATFLQGASSLKQYARAFDAPASRSSRTTSSCPCATAQWSGVQPHALARLLGTKNGCMASPNLSGISTQYSTNLGNSFWPQLRAVAGLSAQSDFATSKEEKIPLGLRLRRIYCPYDSVMLAILLHCDLTCPLDLWRG